MKQHFQVLDGLRGTAAISVVIFHIFELIVEQSKSPFPHGYLAVDFFYALSGFVLGYAYDDRLDKTAPAHRKLSFWDFVKRRLIRLHPVVPVAVTIGLAVYLTNPFVGNSQTIGAGLSLGALLLAYGLNLLLLPSPTLPNHMDETHTLDAPTWTLFWEYIANLAFVLWLHRIRRSWHIVLLALSAGALVLTGLFYKTNLGWGWGWDSLWVAPVRLAYPFLAGLLIFRLGWKISLPQPYVVASLMVVGVLALPLLPDRINGLAEALCVIVAFPLTLAVGASVGEVKGVLGRLCRFTGELSYPLYILHYPFVFLFGHWVWQNHPDPTAMYTVAALLFVFLILSATALLYLYDKPLRAFLTRRFATSSARSPADQAATGLRDCR